MKTMTRDTIRTAATLLRRLSMLAAASVLLCAPAFAGEEKKPASDSDKPKVYTNKDLAKYKGMSPPSPRGKVVDLTAKRPEASKPAPAAMTPAEKEQRIANLKQQIAAAKARVADIDKRVRSLHNPFLPKPEVSEDERQAEAGLDTVGILEKVQAEKDDLTAQIADLEAELEALEAAPTTEAPDGAAGDEAGDGAAAGGADENPPQPSSQEP